ncbi:hypothetical protein R6Q59_020269 [Mikania micrantha]
MVISTAMVEASIGGSCGGSRLTSVNRNLSVDKMSSKAVKMSTNGRRVLVDPRRKIVTQCNAQIVGPNNKSSSLRPSLNKFGKRKSK